MYAMIIYIDGWMKKEKRFEIVYWRKAFGLQKKEKRFDDVRMFDMWFIHCSVEEIICMYVCMK